MPVDYVTRKELKILFASFLKNLKSKQEKFQVNTETLSGDRTLKSSDKRIQFLDPGGADRIIELPPESAHTKETVGTQDITFIIFNTGTGFDLIVKDDTEPPNTIVTISQDEGGIVICNGDIWRGFVGGKT